MLGETQYVPGGEEQRTYEIGVQRRKKYIKGLGSAYIEAIEKAATLLKASNIRKPLQKFTRQTYSIHDFRDDWRDSWLALPLIYHGAIHFGLNADSLFREVAALSGALAARCMIEFIHRKSSDRTLQACKLVEVQTPEGVRLEHNLQ